MYVMQDYEISDARKLHVIVHCNAFNVQPVEMLDMNEVALDVSASAKPRLSMVAHLSSAGRCWCLSQSGTSVPRNRRHNTDSHLALPVFSSALQVHPKPPLRFAR